MKKIHILTDDQLQKLLNAREAETRKRLEQEFQDQLLEKEATLSSLQNQINPHFLYNALEGIRGQAIVDHNRIIADTVHAMANYFRYNISMKSKISTLGEEIDNITNYMAVQKFRFPNRFSLEIKVDEEDRARGIFASVLPRMTLQPVIENAIMHGFDGRSTGCRLCVQIVFNGRELDISVSDNGCGMEPDRLKKLNRSIRNYEAPRGQEEHHNGIALPNIHRRIRLMFGEAYGLHVNSIRDDGTDVIIHVPFRTAVGSDTDTLSDRWMEKRE